MDEIIYVLCPYTHANPRIRQWRVDTCAMYCAALRMVGKHPYAPIVECHPVEAFMPGDRGSVDHWAAYNEMMLKRSHRGLVLPLWGWERSTGIKLELQKAAAFEIPVEFDIDWELTIGEALS